MSLVDPVSVAFLRPGSCTSVMSLIFYVKGKILSSSSMAMHVLQFDKLRIKRSLNLG